MDDDESIQPSRRSKWLPITVLATGTVLIAAPLFYLWRTGKPQRISLNSAPAPPPRRVGLAFAFPAPAIPLANETAPPPPKVKESDWDDADWGVPPPPPDPNDNFNAAFYTFKAFGSATLIVSSLAFAGIWGLRRYLDVDNMEDFGVKMRLAIMNKMPLLALRMRNALGPPKSASDANPEEKPQSGPRWAWEDAKSAWEAKVEMEQRERLKTNGSRKTE
ncbi:hypothetical protein B0H13DRAFT_1978058 [Mycena leptocephala]|nr:hypothetical protein B0H13DRAFT_1978058 [Mycena leptocephala]